MTAIRGQRSEIRGQKLTAETPGARSAFSAFLCASMVKPISDLRLLTLVYALCPMRLASALLLALCSVAEAQQPKKVPRVGYLALSVNISVNYDNFRQGLRELGYVEDQNIVIEYRAAEDRSYGSLSVRFVSLSELIATVTREQRAQAG